MKTAAQPSNDRPTLRWQRYLAEGASPLSEEQIAAVDQILDGFTSQLAGDENPDLDQEAILRILRQAVTLLNEMGGLYGRLGNFIETDEREDLVPFLLEVARRAGLRLPPGEDPTEQWREW